MSIFAGRAIFPSPFTDSLGNGRGGLSISIYNRITYTDGVTTNASTRLTSATAAFTEDDEGKEISAQNFPSGVTVETYVSATEVDLSLPATASGTGKSFTIAARQRTADLATVYADKFKSANSNPYVADSLGNAFPYLDPGDYDAVTIHGVTPCTVLPDPAEPIAAGAVEEAMLSFGVATQAELDTLSAATIPLTQKGAANGVATLGADSRLPNAQLGNSLSVTQVLTSGQDANRSSMADMEVTAKPLRLQKIAGTSPVEGASAVGDKIALYSDTHGIGLQAGRVVVYMPASAALVVRTTSATGNKSAGTDAVGFHPSGDVESFIAGKGVILMSPNGTRYRLTVADDGALTTTAL